ncbi:MAG: hypothetical protein GY795_24850 [Desulfobacterales bacterium]|nr:hypothetical protein [Desulfobacterales bacterium]
MNLQSNAIEKISKARSSLNLTHPFCRDLSDRRSSIHLMHSGSSLMSIALVYKFGIRPNLLKSRNSHLEGRGSGIGVSIDKYDISFFLIITDFGDVPPERHSGELP